MRGIKKYFPEASNGEIYTVLDSLGRIKKSKPVISDKLRNAIKRGVGRSVLKWVEENNCKPDYQKVLSLTKHRRRYLDNTVFMVCDKLNIKIIDHY